MTATSIFPVFPRLAVTRWMSECLDIVYTATLLDDHLMAVLRPYYRDWGILDFLNQPWAIAVLSDV